MTTAEPRFTELDRAELLALAMHRESLCPLCGRPLEECNAREGETEHEGPEFRGEVSVCRATVAILDKQRATAPEDDKPDPYARAYLFAAATRR